MTGYESKRDMAQDKITDEQGRPMTYWGGKAQPALEPVAVVAVNQSGGIRMEYQDGSAFDISKHVGQRFYTTPPQPAQEPVGKVTENTDNGFKCEFNQRLTAGTKLYTSPQRPWVGLTDEEIDQFHNWKDCTWSTNELVRHVEATLRSKNT